MLSKIKSMSLEGLTGYLVEIQSDVAEMAKRSIKLNNLEDRFR